jgi:DNA-binding MarR family transcriptional regulator
VSKAAEISFETTRLVRDKCLCFHLQRAGRALARRFDDAMRPIGLTNGQFSLMMCLNRPEAPTIGWVANFLAMDRTTLTAALKPLLRRRLIKMAVDREDRRSRRLHLTPAGRAILARAVPIWTRTHEEVDRLLLNSDSDRLRESLRALV